MDIRDNRISNLKIDISSSPASTTMNQSSSSSSSSSTGSTEMIFANVALPQKKYTNTLAVFAPHVVDIFSKKCVTSAKKIVGFTVSEIKEEIRHERSYSQMLCSKEIFIRRQLLRSLI
jgi:hypothetical protein